MMDLGSVGIHPQSVSWDPLASGRPEDPSQPQEYPSESSPDYETLREGLFPLPPQPTGLASVSDSSDGALANLAAGLRGARVPVRPVLRSPCYTDVWY